MAMNVVTDDAENRFRDSLDEFLVSLVCNGGNLDLGVRCDIINEAWRLALKFCAPVNQTRNVSYENDDDQSNTPNVTYAHPMHVQLSTKDDPSSSKPGVTPNTIATVKPKSKSKSKSKSNSKEKPQLKLKLPSSLGIKKYKKGRFKNKNRHNNEINIKFTHNVSVDQRSAVGSPPTSPRTVSSTSYLNTDLTDRSNHKISFGSSSKKTGDTILYESGDGNYNHVYVYNIKNINNNGMNLKIRPKQPSALGSISPQTVSSYQSQGYLKNKISLGSSRKRTGDSVLYESGHGNNNNDNNSPEHTDTDDDEHEM